MKPLVLAAAVFATVTLGVAACGSDVSVPAATLPAERSELDGATPPARPADGAAKMDAAVSADAEGALDAEVTDGSSDSGLAGCNTLAQSNALLTVSTVSGVIPAMAGGTIADGVYAGTAYTVYVPSDSGVGVSTDPVYYAMKFAGGTFEAVVSKSGTATDERRNAGTFTTSGSTFAWKQSCPKVQSQLLGYSATATSLDLALGPVGGGGVVLTLKKM